MYAFQVLMKEGLCIGIYDITDIGDPEIRFITHLKFIIWLFSQQQKKLTCFCGVDVAQGS